MTAATPSGPHPPSQSKAAALAGLSRRAEAVRGDFAEIRGHGSARLDPLGGGCRAATSPLRASPVDAAPLLRESFDRHPGPLVFTSATFECWRRL